MNAKYIVIEGAIGVGKTSLAQLLAKELNARLFLEKVEDNPFLTRFYQDRRQFSFQTQIFFLLSRYRQLESLTQQDLFSAVTLSDYFMPKDRIFATLNLEPDELTLYDQIYSLLNPRIPKPDLVIYLQAETDVLMRRIKQRGRDYENDMAWDYLAALNQAYNDFFFYYNDSPLMVVQTSEIDFVKSRADLEDLLEEMTHMKKGTQYYIPRK
ncbi:MAG: deoxynucleoside kinase [Nitrospira sp.]|nr:deoxynucleoside kinase [Nitrospira sp.]